LPVGEKNPALSEIYIVEGDSARFSKAGTRSQDQAISTQRQNILTWEKARFDKMLGVHSDPSLITAWTGIGKKILMRASFAIKDHSDDDADVDGRTS